MLGDLPRLRCSAAIDALPVPQPFALERLRQNLERHRHHQVRLIPASLPPGCNGFWIRTAEADCIIYHRHPRWRRELEIIGHQVAHMVFGHRGVAISDEGIARRLFPHLDPQMIQQTLALSAYTEAEEREAEFFASLLLERIGYSAAEPSSPTAGQYPSCEGAQSAEGAQHPQPDRPG